MAVRTKTNRRSKRGGAKKRVTKKVGRELRGATRGRRTGGASPGVKQPRAGSVRAGTIEVDKGMIREQPAPRTGKRRGAQGEQARGFEEGFGGGRARGGPKQGRGMDDRAGFGGGRARGGPRGRARGG